MMLYHYYTDQNDYAQHSIEQNSIYLSDLSDFNDPLEKDAIFFKEELVDGAIQELSRPKVVDFSNKFGAFCMTKDPKNFLLWSHYANSHKGLCIGYSFPNISTDKISIYNVGPTYKNNVFMSDEKMQVYISKVQYNYQTTLAWKSPGLQLYGPSLNDVISRKHKSWKYEKEYRIYSVGKSRIKLGFTNYAISKIIFGLRCPPEKVADISNLALKMNPKCKLLHAAIDYHSGKINLQNYPASLHETGDQP